MGDPKLPPNHAFGIAFETEAIKRSGLLHYTKVTLEKDVLAMDESVFVNLCEHPLYPALARYVQENPPKEKS